MESNELKNNRKDITAAFVKGAIGAVPLVGGLLGEIVGSIIPNQRVDRLAKYIERLEQKIESISAERLREVAEDENLIDLVEEGFLQASRALSDERRNYISSLVANGMLKSQIDASELKYILNILAQLSDIEIIWLRSYYIPCIEDYKAFREKHSSVLTVTHAFVGSDDETIAKASLQTSYKEHLERLLLIRREYEINKQTKVPVFDSRGRPKLKREELTSLGKILLKSIGLLND